MHVCTASFCLFCVSDTRSSAWEQSFKADFPENPRATKIGKAPYQTGRVCRLKPVLLSVLLLCGLILGSQTAEGATPSITNLSPSSGLVGTSVTISGSNFGTTQGTSTVKFNGTSATP